MPTQPKKCPHGKRKSRCKECGGSELCIHKKQKSQCKECIKKDNEKWKERILALENQIKYWIKHKPEKMIEIVHLFYSEYL